MFKKVIKSGDTGFNIFCTLFCQIHLVNHLIVTFVLDKQSPYRFHTLNIVCPIVEKIKQFQIVQNSFDELQILVIIDEKLRDRGPSVQTILQEIRERFQKAMPKDIAIIVREVKEVEKDARSHTVRVVVSHIKIN